MAKSPHRQTQGQCRFSGLPRPAEQHRATVDFGRRRMQAMGCHAMRQQAIDQQADKGVGGVVRVLCQGFAARPTRGAHTIAVLTKGDGNIGGDIIVDAPERPAGQEKPDRPCEVIGGCFNSKPDMDITAASGEGQAL